MKAVDDSLSVCRFICCATASMHIIVTVDKQTHADVALTDLFAVGSVRPFYVVDVDKHRWEGEWVCIRIVVERFELPVVFIDIGKFRHVEGDVGDEVCECLHDSCFIFGVAMVSQRRGRMGAIFGWIEIGVGGFGGLLYRLCRAVLRSLL